MVSGPSSVQSRKTKTQGMELCGERDIESASLILVDMKTVSVSITTARTEQNITERRRQSKYMDKKETAVV